MNNTDDGPMQTATPQPRRKLSRRWVAFFPLLVAVIAVFAIRAYWFSGSSEAAPQDSLPIAVAPPRQPTPEQPETPAEKERRLLLGSWRDEYFGERTMTFAADGTGVMVIKLDSVGQAIYGEKLLFNLAWTIRDSVLEMKFTGGEPKGAVATISKLWGDTHLQKIEGVSDTELKLRSTDSQNLYTLERLPEKAM